MNDREYRNVTLAEMEAYLKPLGYKQITLEGTYEIVYAKRIDRGGNRQLTLRIYTGINPDGNSRAVGKDGIRATVFEKFTDGTITMVRGTAAVRRTGTWRKNLAERLRSIDVTVPCLPNCPKCQKRMRLVDGKNGFFYGCTGYPACKSTINYDKWVAPKMELCSK